MAGADQGDLAPIEEPPLYAVVLVEYTIQTHGGAKSNGKGQVVDVQGAGHTAPLRCGVDGRWIHWPLLPALWWGNSPGVYHGPRRRRERRRGGALGVVS